MVANSLSVVVALVQFDVPKLQTRGATLNELAFHERMAAAVNASVWVHDPSLVEISWGHASGVECVILYWHASQQSAL
jgi:hypothetical protein